MTSTRRVKTFLEKAEKFMTTFNEVRQQGFFDSLIVVTNTDGQKSVRISIDAIGYIPTEKKSGGRGVPSFVEPAKALRAIRTQLANPAYELAQEVCKIKKNPWLKFDKLGYTAVGKCGTEFVLGFSAILQPKLPTKRAK